MSTHTQTRGSLAAVVVSVMSGCVALPVIIVAESQRGSQTELFGVFLVALAAAVSCLYPGRRRDTGTSPRRRLVAAAYVGSVAAFPVLFLAAVAVAIKDASGGVGILVMCGIVTVVGRTSRGLVAPPADTDTAQANAVRQFFAAYLTGLVLMVFATTLSQAPDAQQQIGKVPPPLPTGALGVAVVCYVLTGFTMLAYLRYTELSVHWRTRAATVAKLNSPRWPVLVLGVLGIAVMTSLVVVVAFLSGMFAPLIQKVDEWAVAAVGSIVGLLHLLALSRKSGPIGRPQPVPRGTLVHSGQAHHALFNWNLFLLDLAIALVVVAALVYFNRHRLRRYWNWFVARLRTLLRRLIERHGGRLGWAMSRFISGPSNATSSRLRRAFGGALSPRDRVLLTYHRLLRQSERALVGRPRGATPEEFGQSLSLRLSDVGDDVASVTQAFVEARYSRHHVDETTADCVDHGWSRVREALRQFGRR